MLLNSILSGLEFVQNSWKRLLILQCIVYDCMDFPRFYGYTTCWINGTNNSQSIIQTLSFSISFLSLSFSVFDILKEDQNRLRKLALQDSSKSSSSNQTLDQSINSLLNNKFVWIIMLLLAIIFYLVIQTALAHIN